MGDLRIACLALDFLGLGEMLGKKMWGSTNKYRIQIPNTHELELESKDIKIWSLGDDVVLQPLFLHSHSFVSSSRLFMVFWDHKQLFIGDHDGRQSQDGGYKHMTEAYPFDSTVTSSILIVWTLF